MAGIFPPGNKGGVPASPQVCNGYTPEHPVVGEGPLYVAPDCTTTFTDCQLNAIVSELLAAVDELGYPFNSDRVDNLGQALLDRFNLQEADIDNRVKRAGDAMTGPLVLPADPTQNNQAANKHYVDTQDAAVTTAWGVALTAAVDQLHQYIASRPQGIEEAPVDGFTYARRDGQWLHLVDAPADQYTYAMSNGQWVRTVNAGGDTMTGPLHLPQADTTAPGDDSAITSAWFWIQQATSAEYLAGPVTDRFLSPNAVWNAMQPVTLSGAAPAPNFSNGFDFIWLPPSGAITLNNPTAVKVGQKGCITLQSSVSGGQTLNYGSNYKFPNGERPMLTGGGAVDVISYYAKAANEIFCWFAEDMS